MLTRGPSPGTHGPSNTNTMGEVGERLQGTVALDPDPDDDCESPNTSLRLPESQALPP